MKHVLVRLHDGERFVTAIDLGEGRKWKRFLVIDSCGVSILKLPITDQRGRSINYREEFLSSIQKKHIRTFIHAGKMLGITKAAETALKEIRP